MFGLLLRLTLFKGRGSNQVNLNPQRALEGGFNPTDFELNLLSLCALVIKADGTGPTQKELDLCALQVRIALWKGKSQ